MTLRDVGIAPYGKCPVVGVGVLDAPFRTPAESRRDVGIAPYGKCLIVGVGVLDDPAECTDLTTNPRRIRTAPRVGGDDLGAPSPNACQIPACFWHRTAVGEGLAPPESGFDSEKEKQHHRSI